MQQRLNNKHIDCCHICILNTNKQPANKTMSITIHEARKNKLMFLREYNEHKKRVMLKKPIDAHILLNSLQHIF